MAKPQHWISPQLYSMTFRSWACASATSLIVQGFFEFLIVGCSQRPSVYWKGLTTSDIGDYVNFWPLMRIDEDGLPSIAVESAVDYGVSRNGAPNVRRATQ